MLAPPIRSHRRHLEKSTTTCSPKVRPPIARKGSKERSGARIIWLRSMPRLPTGLASACSSTPRSQFCSFNKINSPNTKATNSKTNPLTPKATARSASKIKQPWPPTQRPHPPRPFYAAPKKKRAFRTMPKKSGKVALAECTRYM